MHIFALGTWDETPASRPRSAAATSAPQKKGVNLPCRPAMAFLVRSAGAFGDPAAILWCLKLLTPGSWKADLLYVCFLLLKFPAVDYQGAWPLQVSWPELLVPDCATVGVIDCARLSARYLDGPVGLFCAPGTWKESRRAGGRSGQGKHALAQLNFLPNGSLQQALIQQIFTTPFDGSVNPLFCCIFNMLGLQGWHCSNSTTGPLRFPPSERHLADDLRRHFAAGSRSSVASAGTAAA